MSARLSRRWRAPSCDAGSEPAIVRTPTISTGDAVAQATALLAAHGRLALAWLDHELVVRETYGAAAAGIERGQPITRSLKALIGIEADIQALASGREPPIVLANTATDPLDESALRVDLAIYRLDEGWPFLVMVTPLQAAAAAERRLNQEVRKRRFAEAKIVQQAETIARANAELVRANGELEQFAYVISHDLQAPLRALRDIGAVVSDAADLADIAGVRSGTAEIVAQSRRMSSMLTALLSYAAIGRQTDAAEIVDTRGLVLEIARRTQRPGGPVIMIEGEWPRLETLAVPLDVVLRNLVDNAVKHHDRAGGRITLSAAPSAHTIIFAVADDGPGIDPEWHQAIFLPFRKVDDERHYESSGIGLALVKKTLESIGGGIEISSDPARRRGTTFRVTWPRRIAP